MNSHVGGTLGVPVNSEMCNVFHLPLTIEAWPRAEVQRTLKTELEALQAGLLPLHAHTSRGGMVDDNNLAVTVLSVREAGGELHANIGVFFNEIIGGCNCHDDPVSEIAYAEMLLRIDRHNGAVSFG